MEAQEFKVPDGCKKISIERHENKVIIIFEPEKWKPKKDESYFFVNGVNEIFRTVWYNDSTDNKRVAIGNCYPTEESAKARQEYNAKFMELRPPQS